MESSDQYNFSIFRPRNLHGRKNRNVIFSMLLIWAVAVFGFQFLLKAIEKPTTEKALAQFEASWSDVSTGNLTNVDKKAFLNSLILLRGKNTLKAVEQKLVSDAISCFTWQLLPDSIKPEVTETASAIVGLRNKLEAIKGEEYLSVKMEIATLSGRFIDVAVPYTGIEKGSLGASILSYALQAEFPLSMGDPSFSTLGHVMRLYMTHNQSVLTDTNFLGFPFHYFYTAVFLLILFISLCICYNVLIEWRLNKEGIVE